MMKMAQRQECGKNCMRIFVIVFRLFMKVNIKMVESSVFKLMYLQSITQQNRGRGEYEAWIMD
ncbi:unnamed protein product [Paramecium sonneborni]|uniref:Uncharacterized protein n=1 Tax=Paramecium sonneborni TaxID=65129 RepID=A0A8S1LY96_9CILI|nr:unnamed protein product [Paramecium sonneborni]